MLIVVIYFYSGSLVVRLVFLPFEESSYTTFARSASGYILIFIPLLKLHQKLEFYFFFLLYTHFYWISLCNIVELGNGFMLHALVLKPDP